MQNRSKIAKEWFDRAEHDINGAEILFKSGHHTDTIAFLIHQAMEKYLKGFLLEIKEALSKAKEMIERIEETVK